MAYNYWPVLAARTLSKHTAELLPAPLCRDASGEQAWPAPPKCRANIRPARFKLLAGGWRIRINRSRRNARRQLLAASFRRARPDRQSDRDRLTCRWIEDGHSAACFSFTRYSGREMPSGRGSIRVEATHAPRKRGRSLTYVSRCCPTVTSKPQSSHPVQCLISTITALEEHRRNRISLQVGTFETWLSNGRSERI
jgi:hypothetical protein